MRRTWLRFSLVCKSRFLNSVTVPKWCKTIIGLLLLPFCVGAAWAIELIVRESGSADMTWVPLLAGVACWVVVYLLLPKPMWIYVFGHELTHAIWTWACGGRVKKIKASANGGHVIVTKTNFLIALAPYFFPFYAVIVVAVFVAGHLIWNWQRFEVWFHLLLGAAYAFHITLTWHILKSRQTDITQQGYIFSAVVIFLGNAGVLLLAVPLLGAKVNVLTALGLWLKCSGEVLHRIGSWLR